MSRYLPYSPDQGALLPLQVSEVLGSDHLCFFVHRGLERRIREDLAFRYLAGGAEPDYWALNAFRKRHGRALNDSFTQVLELARQMGLRQMGTVAIDATRIKASASPDKTVKQRYVKVRAMRRARGERLEARLKVRRWQRAWDADDPNENAGSRVDAPLEAVEQM